METYQECKNCYTIVKFDKHEIKEKIVHKINTNIIEYLHGYEERRDFYLYKCNYFICPICGKEVLFNLVKIDYKNNVSIYQQYLKKHPENEIWFEFNQNMGYSKC